MSGRPFWSAWPSSGGSTPRPVTAQWAAYCLRRPSAFAPHELAWLAAVRDRNGLSPEQKAILRRLRAKCAGLPMEHAR